MAFATVEEFAARLGRTLTGDQETHVQTLLDLATLAIAGAVDKSEDWAEGLVAPPPAVRVVCIELAVRAFLNSAGARTTQETIGQYSYTATYGGDVFGVGLTENEVLTVRRAVFGTTTAGVRLGSEMVDGTCDEWEGGS